MTQPINETAYNTRFEYDPDDPEGVQSFISYIAQQNFEREFWLKRGCRIGCQFSMGPNTINLQKIYACMKRCRKIFESEEEYY